MAAVKNGREYLTHVTETLRHRITQLNDSIEAGQKEIEGMHEYYWENYTEMDQYGYENLSMRRQEAQKSMQKLWDMDVPQMLTILLLHSKTVQAQPAQCRMPSRMRG